MTKIPSVEETVDEVFQEVMTDIGKYYKVSDRLSDILSDSLGEQLTQALTAQRTALLTELRDSGLLEEKVNHFRCITLEAKCDGHNTLARAIKDHINNLINPSV